MISFSQFPYKRIDFKDFSERYERHVTLLGKSHGVEEAYFELVELDYLERLFVSYATISEAGITNNSFDDFWQEEERFFCSARPRYESLLQAKNEALSSLECREKLKELLGAQFLAAGEMRKRTVCVAAQRFMEAENRLSQEYSNLTSRLTMEVDGKSLNMPQLSRLATTSDRDVRRKYSILMEKALLGIAPELDRLYDDMLAERVAIAKACGFDTYTDYCFCKHARTSYGRRDLEAFAGLVERYVTPVAAELFRMQEKRSGHALKNYDEEYVIPGREVRVKDDLLGGFRKIFTSLSSETKVFFDELCERKFYDLEVRTGKTSGAYSNYMPLCSMPYIFQTYNSSAGAVKTFAHECGHGLHSFLHRGEPVWGATCDSSDLCETHSMSMELFFWHGLENIVEKEDIPLYKYSQLRNCLAFICYGTAIDRFQTMAYDRPTMSLGQRLECWKELEARFLPWRKYEEGLFYAQGRLWQRQIHVMKWPFYYVDYVLAQLCALEFFVMDCDSHSKAWEAYIRLLKDSGRESFLDTIVAAGLKSPFAESTIVWVTEKIVSYLKELAIEQGEK